MSYNWENNLSRPMKPWRVFGPDLPNRCIINVFVGGPARIRTQDQRIMSSPERTGAKEDNPLSPAKQGKVRQKLQPGRNLQASRDND